MEPRPAVSGLGNLRRYLVLPVQVVRESARGKTEAVRSGQIRSFRIAKLDPATKKIELELA